MRFAACAVLPSLLLCGCGYVGPVVPPSPRIPSQITDLAVVENGSDLVVTFTTPPRTVDNLAITKFSTIELRIGPDMQPMNVGVWENSSKEFDPPLPPPNEKDVARPFAIKYTIPAAEWTGQKIAVAVRTAVKNDRNYSNWSNFQHLEVIAPLLAPNLAVVPTAQGYRLTWNQERPGITYKVLRQGAPDQPPSLIGTSDKPEYVDGSALFGTNYIYSVVATKASTESPASNKVLVNFPDTFAPAAPVGLTGLATGNNVELSWQRSPEADLQGYFVYRSTNGAPFERLGGIINLPAYTDTKAQHGASYRYQISAVDRANNEGEKCAPFAVNFP